MKDFDMMRSRNYDIRLSYFALLKHYLKEGYSRKEALAQVYDDISIKFCLCKTSIKNAKNQIPRDDNQLMFEFKSRLKKIKEIIEKIEDNIE